MNPASRYRTREPATATFRLLPEPIIGISTATSSRSRASGGMPVCSCPSTAIVRSRAAGRSASLIASSASSTPMIRAPAVRCSSSHPQASRPVQCTQAGQRRVFPRPSASGTQGGASRRTGAITGIKDYLQPMQPERAAGRLMRMKNELRIAAGLVLAVALAGCAATSPPPPRPVMAHGVVLREPLVSPRPYGAADTAFGLDALGAWCRADPQANLVLSPSSLASGLGMAYLGARGATARAMDGVLHLPAASGQALEAGLQARSTALRGLDGPGVTVNASDQVWADPSLTTLRSYLNAVATGYDAGVAQVPLLHSPDQAAQQIDRAIATATHGLIPQLLAPGSLRDIGWVLTDALYLKAAWATPFQASETQPGPFTTASGRQVSAQF